MSPRTPFADKAHENANFRDRQARLRVPAPPGLLAAPPKPRRNAKAKTAPSTPGRGPERADDAPAVPNAAPLLPENLPKRERIERENDLA